MGKWDNLFNEGIDWHGGMSVLSSSLVVITVSTPTWCSIDGGYPLLVIIHWKSPFFRFCVHRASPEECNPLRTRRLRSRSETMSQGVTLKEFSVNCHRQWPFTA